MRHRSLIVISLLLLISLLVLPLSAAAQDVKTITATPVNDVNIRTFPGVNAGVISVLPANAKATAIGRTGGNNWVQIDYSGTKGWVAGWLVFYSADPASLPITTDTQPNPTTAASTTAYAPRNVNVRASNNTNATLITTIPYNAEVTVAARSADSSWVFVEFGGKTGWAARWLLILRSDVNALAVSTSSTTTNPTPGQTPTQKPGSTPQAPQTPTSPTGITVTAPFRINIRTTPSVSGRVLEVFPAGGQAAALGRNAGNNWIQVQYGNTTGWVAAWVAIASTNTAGLPIVSDTVEVAVNPGNKPLTGTGMYPVIIRSFPGESYAQVGEIPTGGQATLTARTADSSWIKVSYSGIEGWVAAWVIVGSNDFNNLPVIEF